MRGIATLWLLAGVAAAGSCSSPRSLVLVDVVGDQPYGPVTLRLVANGSVSKVFPNVAFDQTTAFRAGVYLPGDISGATAILATAEDGACVIGRGQATVPGVTAGATFTTGVTVVHVPCEPIPGSDAGTDAAGAGGSGAGAGGRAGTGGGGVNGGGGTLGAGGGLGSGGAFGSGGAPAGSGGMPAGSGGAPSGSGGAGSGGRPGTGGAGAGGAGTGGAGTGGAGTGGAGGGCGALVDDMEAATGRICQGSGRVGHWYTFKDSYSTITPDPTQLPALPQPISPPRDTSHYAMSTSGTRVSYAGIGCMLNNSVIGDPPLGFDGSAYTGIQFYVRGGTYAINVTIHNGATISTAYGGHCTATTCVGNWTYASGISSTWGMMRVPFSSLTGGNAPFNRADLWAIEFQEYGGGPFDFWIDDISFY